MSLASLAKNVPSPGPERVVVTAAGADLEFRRPEPSDFLSAYTDGALESLNSAAEILQKEDKDLLVPTKYLELGEGSKVFLMASCYVVSAKDMEESKGGKVAPLPLFLSIAARNSYTFDLIVAEFERVFPQFTAYVLERMAPFLPGNSKGGGKIGQDTQEATPGEVPPPATEPSSESPSTTKSTSKKQQDGDGDG